MKNWQKLRKDKTLWRPYFIREKVIRAIREFFYTEGFHEVETPLLVPAVIPESYHDVFTTKGMFLTTSPEASLKKLIVAGIGNCFEITRSFRNGETESPSHNPEFTILEWYRMDVGYEAVMNDCESLFLFIAAKLHPQSPRHLSYQGKKVDLSPPWERISMKEALLKYAGISFDAITQKNAEPMDEMFPIEKLFSIAEKKGYAVKWHNTWEEVFNQIFLNEVEPQLGREKPSILYEYPAPLAVLSRMSPKDPRFAERFEVYCAGLELADCYTELSDTGEQKKRFARECEKIKKRGKTAIVADREFLQALEIGLPRCAGIAVGVDRLCMLYADVASIADVLFFPQTLS